MVTLNPFTVGFYLVGLTWLLHSTKWSGTMTIWVIQQDSNPPRLCSAKYFQEPNSQLCPASEVTAGQAPNLSPVRTQIGLHGIHFRMDFYHWLAHLIQIWPSCFVAASKSEYSLYCFRALLLSSLAGHWLLITVLVQSGNQLLVFSRWSSHIYSFRNQ
jgi:hypothetical protein